MTSKLSRSTLTVYLDVISGLTVLFSVAEHYFNIIPVTYKYIPFFVALKRRITDLRWDIYISVVSNRHVLSLDSVNYVLINNHLYIRVCERKFNLSSWLCLVAVCSLRGSILHFFGFKSEIKVSLQSTKDHRSSIKTLILSQVVRVHVCVWAGARGVTLCCSSYWP